MKKALKILTMFSLNVCTSRKWIFKKKYIYIYGFFHARKIHAFLWRDSVFLWSFLPLAEFFEPTNTKNSLNRQTCVSLWRCKGGVCIYLTNRTFIKHDPFKFKSHKHTTRTHSQNNLCQAIICVHMRRNLFVDVYIQFTRF